MADFGLSDLIELSKANFGPSGSNFGLSGAYFDQSGADIGPFEAVLLNPSMASLGLYDLRTILGQL